MRSHKRSHSERAFSKGYQAGVAGRSWSYCPFETRAARELWMNGWREGRADHWNGFTPHAQAQKLSNF